MATAVAIMDRPSFDSNTDVLVVADPAARSLVWIPRDLWLSPQRPIEEGKRRIVFEPPFEELSGERIHQWIGARYGADRQRSDLDRIERQRILLAALLRDGYDFGRVLAQGLPIEVSGPGAIEELAQVRPTWRFETLDGLSPARIEGMMVLTRAGSPGRDRESAWGPRWDRGAGPG